MTANKWEKLGKKKEGRGKPNSGEGWQVSSKNTKNADLFTNKKPDQWGDRNRRW